MRLYGDVIIKGEMRVSPVDVISSLYEDWERTIGADLDRDEKNEKAVRAAFSLLYKQTYTQRPLGV